MSQLTQTLQEVVELDRTTQLCALELVYTVIPMDSEDERSEDRYEAIAAINAVACEDENLVHGILDLNIKMSSDNRHKIYLMALSKATAEDKPEEVE